MVLFSVVALLFVFPLRIKNTENNNHLPTCSRRNEEATEQEFVAQIEQHKRLLKVSKLILSAGHIALSERER